MNTYGGTNLYRQVRGYTRDPLLYWRIYLSFALYRYRKATERSLRLEHFLLRASEW